jgi:hypothetical protein
MDAAAPPISPPRSAMPPYVAGRIHRASFPRYGERTFEETIKDCSPRISSRIEIRSFLSHFRDSSVTGHLRKDDADLLEPKRVVSANLFLFPDRCHSVTYRMLSSRQKSHPRAPPYIYTPLFESIALAELFHIFPKESDHAFQSPVSHSSPLFSCFPSSVHSEDHPTLGFERGI